MSDGRTTLRVVQRLMEYAPAAGTRAVVSIGNFDGVHIGHQAVFAKAREVAAQPASNGLPTPIVAITFDPSPVSVLRPSETPERLTTINDRLALLAANGVTDAVVLRPDAEMLRTPAEEFLAQVIQTCRPRAFVEGPGFHFGHARRGSVETLREFAAQYDYSVHEVPPTRVPALPRYERASSSAIRSLLNEGDVAAAAAMLGRAHLISGVVETGQGRGAPLGFPTANLGKIPQMLPKAGVYAAVAETGTGERFLTAVNVGTQPTFDQKIFRVESHLLDFSGDLRGRPLRILFCERLRDQRKFGSVQELVAQIRQDVEAVRSGIAAAASR